MASKQSEALKDLYKGWAKVREADPNLSLEGLRELFDHWADVTAETTDVEYTPIDAGGVPALWAIPRGAALDRVLIGTHGGGYVVGSLRSHRKMFGHIAKAVGARVLILDYRLSPEHPHPAPVEDALKSYRWLLGEQGIEPRHIALVGDSAGGGLAITQLLKIRDAGLPLPAASIPISPWTDLEITGESVATNAAKDFLVQRSVIEHMSATFLGADGKRNDPLASPLYGDFRGLPPLYVQVGGDEALLDDSRRFVDKARKAGVDVRFDIYPDQQHVFQFMAGNAPEADKAIRDLAGWVRPHLGLS